MRGPDDRPNEGRSIFVQIYVYDPRLFGLFPTDAKTGIVALCALQGVAQFFRAAGEFDVHFLPDAEREWPGLR